MEIIDSPALAIDDWLLTIEREYFAEFLGAGGAAVKFAIADADAAERLPLAAVRLADRHAMALAHLNAGATRLHMLQDVFFALARALPWDTLADRYLEDLFARNDYPWPNPGQRTTMAELAHEHGVAVNLLTRSRDQWLSREIWDDPSLARDFRSAMLHLCLARLEPDAAEDESPVLGWLRGEKVALGLLRQFEIAARIGRVNARAMLVSACHWLRKCGMTGLLLTLDLRPALRAAAAGSQTIRYSPSATMDMYEVLRELIDDIERMPGLFVLALADTALVAGDGKRTLDSYKALEMRIWPDVRPGDRQNPLAPLVTVQL